MGLLSAGCLWVRFHDHLLKAKTTYRNKLYMLHFKKPLKFHWNLFTRWWCQYSNTSFASACHQPWCSHRSIRVFYWLVQRQCFSWVIIALVLVVTTTLQTSVVLLNHSCIVLLCILTGKYDPNCKNRQYHSKAFRGQGDSETKLQNNPCPPNIFVLKLMHFIHFIHKTASLTIDCILFHRDSGSF